MPDQVPALTHSRRRWPWILLGLIFLLAGTSQVYRSRLHTAARRELSRLQSQGYAVDVMQLEARLGTVPDLENAAIGIMEAADFLVLEPDAFRQEQWPVGREPLSAEQKESLEFTLTNNTPTLEAVHAAVRLPKSQFPVEYRLGFRAPLPHLAKVKSLANLLKAEAFVYAEAGQVDTAVRSVVDCFDLARALESEPLLISQLVRNASLMIACSALERVLNQHALPEPPLRKLLEVIRAARSASPASVQGGYMGELCIGVFCFEAGPTELLPLLADSGSEISPWMRVAYPVYAWSGLRDRDFLFYLRTMHELLDSAQAPLPDRLAKTKALGTRTEQVLKLRKLLLYSGMLLPSLQRSTERAAETEAYLRVAEAALLVELYRVQQGGLPPADLGQVAPLGLGVLPVDPVDGAPLRYRKLSTGYLIYSVGADGTDQNGQERRRVGRARTGSSASNSPGTHGYDIILSVDR